MSGKMKQVKECVGVLMDVGFKLGDAVQRAGGDGYEDMRLLTTDKGKWLLGKIAGVLADANDSRIRKVEVDRTIDLELAIRRCKFDEVDPRISGRFVLPKSPSVLRENVPIVSLGYTGTIAARAFDETLLMLRVQGRRAVTPAELLAMAASEHGCRFGASFAFGSPAGEGDNKFVCYVDTESAFGEVRQRRLKMVHVNDIGVTMTTIAEREKEAVSDRNWILAVRV